MKINQKIIIYDIKYSDNLHVTCLVQNSKGIYAHLKRAQNKKISTILVVTKKWSAFYGKAVFRKHHLMLSKFI
jgi:hypothetical protein